MAVPSARPPGAATTITGRYPAGVGQTFVAIPDELFRYRRELDLDSGAMTLVHALERRRWRYAAGAPVKVTFEMLTADTGDSEATLIRRVKRLESAGLLNVTRSKNGPARSHANHYDLKPLWKKLAKLAAKDVREHRQIASSTTCKMTAKEEPLAGSLKELPQKSSTSHHHEPSTTGDEKKTRAILRLAA